MSGQSTADGPTIPRAERKYSGKYIEYLVHWETARRVRKAAPGPQDGYQSPTAIHGIPVARKGRGQPPADDRQSDYRVCAKKQVPNMSYACSEGLLSRPMTADAVTQLHIDEHRTKSVLRQSGMHNNSSLTGPGAVVGGEPTTPRPKRNAGQANPNRTLGSEMSRLMAYEEQTEEEAQQQQRLRLVWSVVDLPPAVDSIVRHRMSDPDQEPAAPKFDAGRMPAPNTESCRMEERRLAFYESLASYARNKVRGEFGSMRAPQSTGLRALAGLAC